MGARHHIPPGPTTSFGLCSLDLVQKLITVAARANTSCGLPYIHNAVYANDTALCGDDGHYIR